MRCLHCGAKAPRHASVCPECGRKLLRINLPWWRCASCGAWVHSSRGFCAACGQPVSRPRVAPLIIALLGALLLGWLALANRQAAARFVARQLAPLPAALQAAAQPPLATVTLAPLAPQANDGATPPVAAAARAVTSTPQPTVATQLTPTLTPTQLPTQTPTITASISATATPTDTPVPTATATATSTVVATATVAATAEPAPTEAAPATPTTTPPTGAPPSDTSVTPASLLYAAPVLIAPADGFVFAGQGTSIWLRWESVGELGADDYYAVSLRYQKNGGVAYSGTWYKGTEWLAPGDLWQQYDPGHPEYEWDVVVMRQTGAREDGGRVGEAVGAVSETRRFTWE